MKYLLKDERSRLYLCKFYTWSQDTKLAIRLSMPEDYRKVDKLLRFYDVKLVPILNSMMIGEVYEVDHPRS